MFVGIKESKEIML